MRRVRDLLLAASVQTHIGESDFDFVSAIKKARAALSEATTAAPLFTALGTQTDPC